MPWASITIPISEMTKLRLKEIKELAPGHTAGRGQSCIPQALQSFMLLPSLDPFDPESKARW